MRPFAGAVLVAAGKGNRLKAGKRKARVLLQGKPLFSWSLHTLGLCPEIGEICLVVHTDDLAALRKWLSTRRLRVPVKVVAGGKTRQDSVFQGAAALDPGWKVILVHDAARPFATVSLIRRCACSAQKRGSGVAAVEVKDTIKWLRHGRVQSLPRQELWAAQTPQAARAAWLNDSLKRARTKKMGFTDEAGLLEAFGHVVALVQGDHGNIKITTPEDLKVAREIARGWEA